jgi:hypothetical protein
LLRCAQEEDSSLTFARATAASPEPQPASQPQPGASHFALRQALTELQRLTAQQTSQHLLAMTPVPRAATGQLRRVLQVRAKAIYSISYGCASRRTHAQCNHMTPHAAFRNRLHPPETWYGSCTFDDFLIDMRCASHQPAACKERFCFDASMLGPRLQRWSAAEPVLLWMGCVSCWGTRSASRR